MKGESAVFKAQDLGRKTNFKSTDTQVMKDAAILSMSLKC